MVSFCLVTLLVLSATGRTWAELQYIDLTHELSKDAVFWPGIPPLNLTVMQKGLKPGGFWLEYNAFSVGEHGGTHMDAPAHFSRNGWHMSDIPLNRLIGPGVVIDITERARTDPEAQLTVADLEAWERQHGKIPSNAWVLLNSGWTQKWNDRKAFLGAGDVEDHMTFRFPSISGEAARWLWQNRPYITGVGLDTASLDAGPSQDYPAHLALLPNRRIGLENVANLDQVPASGAMIHAIPIKLKDGSGGPMRLFAVVGDAGSTLAAVRFDLVLLLAVGIAYVVVQ